MRQVGIQWLCVFGVDWDGLFEIIFGCCEYLDNIILFGFFDDVDIDIGEICVQDVVSVQLIEFDFVVNVWSVVCRLFNCYV